MKKKPLYCSVSRLSVKAKPRNPVAKDLRSPKYSMRVEVSKKAYNRSASKLQLQKDIYE